MNEPQDLWLPGRLPGLNEYIAAMNSSRYTGNSMKQEHTDAVAWQAKKLRQVEKPVFIQFIWKEPNRLRDPDNIVFAKKFILDGLVLAGVLPNDNQKWIIGFQDYLFINEKRPGVGVILFEREE